MMMGTASSPIDLINTTVVDCEDDDDDDVSVLYSSPQSPPLETSGTNADNAISVEHYSDVRDFQLAIMASLLPVPTSERFVDLSRDDDDVEIVNASSSRARARVRAKKSGFREFEKGESSTSSKSKEEEQEPFMCEICVEPKTGKEAFRIKGCAHIYCSDCMIKYVASRLQENISHIRCPDPDCSVGVLEPEDCRSILPPDVFDRWGNALCEAVILGSHKFYCPYKDCSALMLYDDRSAAVTRSECPNCWRLFCARCKVAWHDGIDCAGFQKLRENERDREDIMLMKLAKSKKWKRCPSCRFYVERSEGCLFMRCRCGYTFCYNCGAHLKDHYCSKCKH